MPYVIGFQRTSYSIDESVGSFMIRITLDGILMNKISISVVSTDGTASGKRFNYL